MAQKKSRTTEWRQRRAAQTIATRLTDNDGLPMRGRVDGRVTTEERAEYQERRLRHLQRHPDYDAGWRRPTDETAKAVWELLADSLEVELADVHPDRLTAQQLLVVALDLAVCAGRYAPPQHLRPDEDLSRRHLRRAVTKTRLFDALARRWSDNYRQTREAGRAFQVGDMREDTVRWCRRDLLLNNINFDVLWDAITGHWSKKRGRNPLFWVNRAPKQKGRKNTGWGGYNVLLRLHSRSLKKFERLVQADTQYHRLDGVLRVWIDGQERPPVGMHADIAAEVAYNVVDTDERSNVILKLQDETRIMFNVDAFKADYKRTVPVAKALNRELRRMCPFPRKPKKGGTVEKRQWTLEERRLLGKYRHAHSFVLGFRGVYDQVRDMTGYVQIRSEFYRVVNRRFQPAHFWPVAASNTLDEGPAVSRSSSRHRWFRFPNGDHPLPMLGVDISSSQTQLLAVLLGCDALEDDATSKVAFKKTLALIAWKYHTKNGGLLLDGYGDVKDYNGPDDPRLIELTKSLWMKRLYGSKVRRIVQVQSWDPDTYGPGWADTTIADWSATHVEQFLETIPYYREVDRFLDACTWIGKNADAYDGVTFKDPLDRSTFTWNPVARRNERLILDDLELTVRLPLGKERVGRYPVKLDKLARMVAPCVVHMLDAFYSALVMEELSGRGVQDFVAVHDSWFVPPGFITPTPEGCPLQSGGEALAEALGAAGGRWLQGLGPVYDRLCDLLGPHPDYGPMIRVARAKWEDRVRREEWPDFMAKRVTLFKVLASDHAR